MKVCITPPRADSRALNRVVAALAQYAPSDIEIIADLGAADLVVLHVIGRQDRNRKTTEWLKARGRQYAIIQYCLRSTMRPSTENWFPLWRDAVLTWSYFDLKALCAEDGTSQDFPFYHAPLGVDASIFYPRDYRRQFVIGTSGHESVREVASATRRVSRPMFHLGPELNRGSHIICMSGMNDDSLAHWYSRCEFIAGLRRTEGFELPAAEGLLCGARPICFDRPHYRQWFGPWAVFIPESHEQVIDSLETVFRCGARPVADAEREAAQMRFDWRTIIGGFWRKIMGNGTILCLS